jgi:hypothetical protein
MGVAKMRSVSSRHENNKTRVVKKAPATIRFSSAITTDTMVARALNMISGG